MPLQNRVTPFGELFATTARGTLMGNRGGRIHNDERKLTVRRWTSKQWICCRLDFNNRHRKVWGDSYTELFFLDEVTALAAGHRPCFECRRQEAERFAMLFAQSFTARPRESGDLGPQTETLAVGSLDSRLRGNERSVVQRAGAKAMDQTLHAERLDGKVKRRHRCKLDTLPDGAMIVRGGEAFAVRGNSLLHWTAAGYDRRTARPRAITADVLTPPAILTVLARGYAPQWHPSAA